jgi:hypothetical protein
MLKQVLLATAVAAITFAAHARQPAREVELTQLGTFETGVFDDGAAEIVAYDAANFRLYVINAAASTVDVLDIADPALPGLLFSIDVEADFPALAVGGINSVDVHDELVAIAVENDNKQANGWAVFYDISGNPLGSVAAGALPDSIAITPDGRYALVANEGEPNGDYSVDPEGSISVIDLRDGVAGATVRSAGFSAFNVPAGSPAPNGVRAPRPRGASIAQDLEPEFITVSRNSRTAWVTLQENSAVAIVDIRNAEVVDVVGLGYKDHSLRGFGLDPSDRDDAVAIGQWPLRGLYMPDGMDNYRAFGRDWIVTANEGDGREYLTDATDEADCTAQGGFDFDDGDCLHYLDEIRVKDIEDTGATIGLPDAEALAEDEAIGRINVITDLGVTGCSTDSLTETGQPGEGCVYEQLYSYGARSISIFDAGGRLVSDTGDAIEQAVAAAYPCDAGAIADESCPFNADNDENFSFDSRSDAKGPEPEGVVVGKVRGRSYAFVGLERVGGIIVFDVSLPWRPRFSSYTNNRDFSVADVEGGGAGDLGPEGLLFIEGEDSPTGDPLLVVGNEVSGTTTIYGISVN